MAPPEYLDQSVVQVPGAAPLPISKWSTFEAPDGWTRLCRRHSVTTVTVVRSRGSTMETATTPVLFSVGAIGMPRCLCERDRGVRLEGRQLHELS